MSLQELVNKYMSTPLSGAEIFKLTGVYPILYSDLNKYKTLEQLLGSKKYCIILYQTSSKTSGHYNAIGINGNGDPYQFDPYGYPDIKIQQLSQFDKKLPDYITPLLEDYANRKNKKVILNNIDFQSKAGNIADCGRWSGIACLLTKRFSFEEIANLFLHNLDRQINGDFGVTVITLLALNDLTN